MRKLKIEDLEVVTFVTGEDSGALGTVKANSLYDDSMDTFCPTNPEYGTCVKQTYNAQSCRASCPNYTCEGITCGMLIC
ncbi:hypothetical protein [Longimicrobium sp.]|uniref:hypothetical protein n=1 Tax=Longimicrobium sp. TaxID=2029185 RepID=UPI002E34F22E|nr:hypothetical protein [Longimicrobium sp.]HEX6037605.1 hypothetical protein [Longimicrobium sp.]